MIVSLPNIVADPSFFPRIPELINAIVSFLWLVVACIAFWKFYRPLKAAIDARSLSVDIGGFKLSFSEATEGLKRQVSDLQTKLAEMEIRLAQPHAMNSGEQPITSVFETNTPMPVPPPVFGSPESLRRLAPSPRPTSVAQSPAPVDGSSDAQSYLLPHNSASQKLSDKLALRILWVDDVPKNNAYEISTIQSSGGTIETALSTSEALEKFRDGAYQAVITDMGRKEESTYKPNAGIELIRGIRGIDKTVPIFVFSSGVQANQKKVAIQEAGGNGATSSQVELFQMLRESQKLS